MESFAYMKYLTSQLYGSFTLTSIHNEVLYDYTKKNLGPICLQFPPMRQCAFARFSNIVNRSFRRLRISIVSVRAPPTSLPKNYVR